MRVILTILAATFFLGANPAWAQSLLPLSMKRAVEIALTPDGATRVALAQESIVQAQRRVAEAKAAFLPNLDTTIAERRQTTNLQAFGLGISLPVAGFSLPTIVGPYTIFDARASVQQAVMNFSDMKKYQASKANLAAIRSDMDTTKLQVSDDVAHQYLLCLRSDAVRDTARANVELSEALLKLAQRQKGAGVGTGIDVTRAEVQLANDRQRMIHADNDRNLSQLQLLKTMGLRLDAAVEFTDKLVFKAVDIAAAESLLEQARKARPELKTQLQRETAARLSYSAVKAESLPTLGAGADYGAIGPDVAASRATYTMGVSLKVPLFDGFRRQARREETFSQYRQEQTRTRDMGQQIELQVRAALETLRSAAAEVDASTNGLSLAENELAQARRRYEAGVSTSLEVTDTQTRLQRARYNQVIALYDYNAARLDLASATGNIGDYLNQ